MDEFLRENYEWIGDKYLAEMFSIKFPKTHAWTLKHIEKRRSYLNLKRTSEAITCIRMVNTLGMCQEKVWDKRGRLPEGTIRIRDGRKFIKVNGVFVNHARYVTNAKPGDVVRINEGGFRIIDLRQNAIINNKRRASLPRELKQAIRVLNKLKKIVYGKENRRPQRNIV